MPTSDSKFVCKWIYHNHAHIVYYFFKKIRDRREHDQKFRIVYLNRHAPDGYEGEEPLKYSGNEIKTSKVIWNWNSLNLE